MEIGNDIAEGGVGMGASNVVSYCCFSGVLRFWIMNISPRVVGDPDIKRVGHDDGLILEIAFVNRRIRETLGMKFAIISDISAVDFKKSVRVIMIPLNAFF